MQMSLDLLGQIASMILMVAVGFLFSRFHIISGKESRVLTQACVYALIPCLLFNAFQSDLNRSQLSGLGLAFVGSVGIHIVAILATRALRKTKLHLTPEEEASIIYSNAGNFVLPIICGLATLGPSYVFYPAPFFLVQNILMWSHGILLIGHDKSVNWKKIICNPCVIAVLLGITCFFLQIRLSGPIASAVSSFSACVGPISMLVVGALLGEQDLKPLFANLRLYLVAALRLLVFPVLAMLVLWGLSCVWSHPDQVNILTALFLCAIGPSANTVTQIAQLYKSKDTTYVSTINVLTVVLCAITMPIIVAMFSFLLAL